VLVDAAGGVCASAVAEGDAASLEVAEELFPFGVGRGAVFLYQPPDAVMAFLKSL